MKLVGSLTSPFVRKTRIVFAEKKIDYEFVNDSPWADDTSVPTFNPLGKVPVLQLKDGSTLFDSRVIVEYVDNLSPSNRLIPANGRERINVLRWEALADGINDAATTIFIEEKRPLAERSQDWLNRQRLKITRALHAASLELGENTWCGGAKFSLADIALGSALGYLNFRFGEVDWRSQYPNLSELMNKLSSRPSFVDTMPQA